MKVMNLIIGILGVAIIATVLANLKGHGLIGVWEFWILDLCGCALWGIFIARIK